MVIGELSAGVTIMANIGKALGKLVAFAEKQRTTEISAAIMEVQNLVLQLQEQMLRDRASHEDLKRKYRELEEGTRARREDFELRENVFWKREGGAGPYCPKCLQREGIPLVAELLERGGLRFCAVCQFQVNTPERDRRIEESTAASVRRQRERGRSWMGD